MKVGDLVTWKWSDDKVDIGVVVKTDDHYGFVWVQWTWAAKPGKVFIPELEKIKTDKKCP